MSIISIGGAQSYTIPLDSLDLTYLGKYVSTPRPEKMPLWTKKRLDGELEYCQVEIITQGSYNEDCYSEATDTYRCYICNINMTKNCYQRHNKSDQHETLKKINQKLLERVSKQKYVISMNTDEDIDSDSYYCEPCSKIIEIGNKNNHEATDYHAKSVKDSIIINDFYKLLNENISNDMNQDLLEEESEPFNPDNSYDMYDSCTSMEASSSNESDDDPDQNSILAPATGYSIIDTVNPSLKVEENEELLEEQSDPFIPNKNYDTCDKSMEASSIDSDDDLSDQNSILALAPGNSIIKTVNPSPKVEENEELLEEQSDTFIPNKNYDMCDKSMEASSIDSDDDLSDQSSILAPAPGNSIIKTVNPSLKGEENEELLEEQSDTFIPNKNYDMCDKSMEASSIDSDDDLSDQSSILAPAPGNSIIKTVNPSPKGEENEELLEEQIDTFIPNKNYDMCDKSMEASSIDRDDVLSDQNSILAPAPGNSIIKTVNPSPKGEENEELLEEKSNPFIPNKNYDVCDKSMEASSIDSDDVLSDQNSILAPTPENSIIETVIQSPKGEGNGELLDKQSDPVNLNNSYDMYDSCTNMEENSTNKSVDDLSDLNSNLAVVPGQCTIETVIEPPKVEEDKSFEEYLKKMIKRYNLEVTPPLSVYGEFIILVAPNGDKVKVYRDNFHGYIVIRENMYCQICNMGIWGTDDTSEHDITELHVRNLFKPINDNFARRIGKIWSHCVPCNALVLADSDLHALKSDHKQIIDSKKIPKPDKTRCEDCSLYIDTNSFSDHLSSETHLRTLELIEQNSIHDFGNNEFFCKICNQILPKYALNFHIGTEPHLSSKTNDATVVSNENNDTTINDENNALTINVENNASTINDENNASTINDENNAFTINNENNASTINDENNASTINDENNASRINDENNTSTINYENNASTINDENNASTINYENNASTINDENHASTVNDENKASTNDAPTEIIDKNDSLATGVNVTDARFCEMCKARLPGELSSANINNIKPSVNVIDDLSSTSANTGSSYSTYRINDRIANKRRVKRSNYRNAFNHGNEKNDTCREIIEFVDETRTIARCKICFVEITYTERNLMDHMRGRYHMGILQIWEQYDKLKLENCRWYNKEKMEKYNKKVVRKYTKLLFISHCLLKCEICDVNLSVDEKSLLSHTRGKKHVLASNYHYYQNGQKL